MRPKSCSDSPERVVLLHHPEPGGQLDAVERAAEAAEPVPVARAQQQVIVVAGVLALAGEGQPRAAAELDRVAVAVAVAEGDGSRLARLAVEPDASLAAALGVVDSSDQVPGE